MSRAKKHDRDRERESSRLSVRGTDAKGARFLENTETIDISETGISFYLTTPIWVDSHLEIEITSSSFFGPKHTAQAKVVRVRVTPDKRQFVAARFD
jgi:PilZ domain-containing protein